MKVIVSVIVLVVDMREYAMELDPNVEICGNKSRIRREWRRHHARSPQPAHKSSNRNPLGDQIGLVNFKEKWFQNIFVLLSKVVRDALRPERKRSDDDYSL